MDLAKVPDNDKKWEALDIFLFSNGLPQQTPPRKYHLTVEDLNNWENTLRTLAHSQYDTPQSTIGIYSVDGQKVISPTEITSENVYVAVLSQEKFVPAGYTEYLLKATRSREKRLSKFKKTSNIFQGPYANKLAPKEEIVNKKISNDNPTGNNTSSLGDQPISGPQQPPSTRYSLLGKPLDKRLNNNSALLRKNNSYLANNMTPRASLKSKENLTRKNLKVSTGKVVSKEPITVINNSNTLKPKPKVISKIGLDSAVFETPKKPDEKKKLSSIIDDLLANEKNCLTVSSQLQSIIDDKELIVVKNIESIDLTADKSPPIYGQQTLLSSVIPVMPVVEENKTIHPNKEEANLTVMNNYVDNIFNPDVAVNNDVLTKNEDTIKMDHNSMPPDLNPKNNDVTLNIPNPDNNFISIIQKDDIIKLNLKIEIRKAAGIVSAHYINDINRYHSLAEKSSQVEINEIFVQSIDKKTQGTAKITRTDEIPNTTALHCGCSDKNLNEIINKINASVDLEGKRVFILTDPEYVKRWPCCNCGQETAIEVPKDKNFSIDAPIKKVYADTTLIEKSENNVPLTKEQNIIVTASQMQSSSKAIIDHDHVIEMGNELLLRDVNLSHQQIVPQCSLIVRKNGSSTIKQFVDISTQTEWSSLLLEARLHEDGRYSFHLPSLQILKQYKM